jgi:hypothetical protein
MKGLEPPRLAAPDPKSGAAANYATSAAIWKGKVKHYSAHLQGKWTFHPAKKLKREFSLKISHYLCRPARVAKLANVAVSEAVGVITLGVRVSPRAQNQILSQ